MLRLLRKGQPRYAETFVCDVMKQTLRVCGPVKLRKFQKEEENHGKSWKITPHFKTLRSFMRFMLMLFKTVEVIKALAFMHSHNFMHKD